VERRVISSAGDDLQRQELAALDRAAACVPKQSSIVIDLAAAETAQNGEIRPESDAGSRPNLKSASNSGASSDGGTLPAEVGAANREPSSEVEQQEDPTKYVFVNPGDTLVDCAEVPRQLEHLRMLNQ
jgi:hypothetical protein